MAAAPSFLVVCLLIVNTINCLPAHSPGTKFSPTPTQKFSKHTVLDPDGNFHLFWNFNSTHITFEAHVKTHGYVGLGLSPNGKMYPADIVIGWVKHGRVFLKDRHSTGQFEPVIDASQDWILLHGEENQHGTVIKTVRKLDTCDDDDVKITNDTVLVIYSYSDHEPEHEGEGLVYHGTHRGAKSLMLLTETKTTAMPSDVISRDLLNNRFSHQELKMLVPDSPYVEPPSARHMSMVSKMTSLPTTPNPCGSPVPSEKFDFQENIDPDGKYVLFWNVNKTHIVFEAQVETKGYIGFGLSPNGKMYPADVVVGWVKDGVPHFKDMHTIGHSRPIVDSSQDWQLLYAKEDSCRTLLKMVRKLDTCDDKDFKITDDTVKIIYSYHQTDPVSHDSIMYHGVNRGVKSLLLLSKLSPPILESDSKVIDFFNNNYHVPAVDTTYSCRIFDLSTLHKKHHLTKFEVIVQKGHDVLVHHIVLYKCPGINRSLIHSSNYVCYKDLDKSKHPCGKTVAIWAVGGEAFYFPDEAGLPVAEPGDTDLYIMETHYNNPGLRNDLVDNSGLRLTVTPTLRLHDAGILEISAVVDQSQVIPPHQPNFVSTVFCNESILHQGLKDFPNGVRVFGVQQHAHLLGKAIKTRLIRGGVEQKPLVDDRHYDFNYQEFRRTNRTLRDGDRIILECTYDSTGRTNVTYGGFSTSEEMCISSLFHYPRTRLYNCLSKPLYDRFHHNTENQKGLFASLASEFNAFDWKNSTIFQEFNDSLASDSYLYIYGHEKNMYNYSVFHPQTMYPKVPYTEPIDTICTV
ncbi:DBH-like monooxygenase protein 1 homolog [Saccostrea echinata]|uniref:DBH-like monooxygenase protein 1 homolog n=1 Tax=Saccostrea echinata TaxID=191078 RepID=UPI002A7EE416|nr:DBH-like monooxygenase protein 1 homolog [Saccostrea echinata]